VISPRNTADVLSGAHQFLKVNSEHKITLRTTDQFNGLEEDARQALIKNADLVFVGGVYGDSVSLFKNYLTKGREVSPASFVAVHSDRSLVLASRINNDFMLAHADLDELMKDPPADIDVEQWSSSRLAQFSEHKNWFLSKTFWADRNTNNIDGLFRHLTHLTGAKIDVPSPILQAPLRVFVDGKQVSLESVELSPENRWVAVVDYETGGRPGERVLIEQFCAQVEAKQGLKCLTVLAKWGESHYKTLCLVVAKVVLRLMIILLH